MDKIIIIGCTRPKHAPTSPDKVIQNAMHQANSLQKCLQGVSPAYVWWRFNPAMKPHSAAKVPSLGQNRTELDTKGNSLS